MTTQSTVHDYIQDSCMRSQELALLAHLELLNGEQALILDTCPEREPLNSENGEAIEQALDEVSDLIENEDYLVLTDEEADEKLKEYIKDSLWAFNSEFILEQCDLDFSGADSLRQMQSDSSEGANDFILSLVEKTCGLDEFVEAAESADGRGHFLSQYDGEENYEDIAGETYYIYRNN